MKVDKQQMAWELYVSMLSASPITDKAVMCKYALLAKQGADEFVAMVIPPKAADLIEDTSAVPVASITGGGG